MEHLPPGWVTDLAILRLSGSTVEDVGDHVIVRSPQNPRFHWGNCLFVTDRSSVGDADRWVARFRSAFPDAGWTAIGLIEMPQKEQPWIARGLRLELHDVLTTRTVPRQTPLADGYSVRRLSGTDWDLSEARMIADRGAEDDLDGYAQFAAAQTRLRRELSDRDVAAYFGAFAGEALVAELGIVRCDGSARYQSVGTDEAHRRRGLASHLLGVAARWAADMGCHRWVIVTEATNPAGAVYRRVGFEPDVGSAQAYRAEPLPR
jgi:GNAT superfamily N-acetyltransferase